MSAQKYRDNFFILDQDLQNLQTIGKLVVPELHQLLEDYYEFFRNDKTYMNHFSDEKRLKQTKDRQLLHWQLFFKGELNDEYIVARQRIGETHWQIGLNLESYFTGMTRFRHLFDQLFRRLGITDYELINSFQKMVSLDTSITSDTYNHLLSESMKAQNEALRQLSTPIAQLWEGILLLPLVGIVDSTRAQDILSSVLQTVAATQSKVFILDIGGVAVVDTAVANHLIKITKATRLMGCLCILSGISPAIAQTIVELGIATDEIETTANMKDALQIGFKIRGISLQIQQNQ
jgi:rsbT co-antagonist protein RsbR